MLHRIREAWMPKGGGKPMRGPIEVDEIYVGRKRKALAEAGVGRVTVGKMAVVGAKDRWTNQVSARVVAATDKPTLQGFVAEHAMCGTTIYTDDEAAAYKGMRNVEHQAVNHSVAEYVRGKAHTNGVESFWSMLKRAHMGTFHKLSAKHLDRYVQEFAGKHSLRESDTLDQMTQVVSLLAGRRLGYRRFIADNGLSSGARA